MEQGSRMPSPMLPSLHDRMAASLAAGNTAEMGKVCAGDVLSLVLELKNDLKTASLWAIAAPSQDACTSEPPHFNHKSSRFPFQFCTT